MDSQTWEDIFPSGATITSGIKTDFVGYTRPLLGAATGAMTSITGSVEGDTIRIDEFSMNFNHFPVSHTPHFRFFNLGLTPAQNTWLDAQKGKMFIQIDGFPGYAFRINGAEGTPSLVDGTGTAASEEVCKQLYDYMVTNAGKPIGLTGSNSLPFSNKVKIYHSNSFIEPKNIHVYHSGGWIVPKAQYVYHSGSWVKVWVSVVIPDYSTESDFEVDTWDESGTTWIGYRDESISGEDEDTGDFSPQTLGTSSTKVMMIKREEQSDSSSNLLMITLNTTDSAILKAIADDYEVVMQGVTHTHVRTFPLEVVGTEIRIGDTDSDDHHADQQGTLLEEAIHHAISCKFVKK